MPTLDITDDHADRIEALREELEASHAGPYASVDREDTLAYLLDLADAVEDPDRVAAPQSGDGGDDEPVETTDAAADAVASAVPYDRDRARELLTARNRRDSDPDPDDPMDLSDIAAAFDITGRSEMTKDELIDAILDAAEELAADPFARVDVDLGGDSEVAGDDASGDDGDDASGDDGADEIADEGSDGDDSAADEGSDGDDSAADDGGAGQLNAMMSLLDTHDDKWREADGDARYEVDLPDGSVETARTKDDVRALLFRNY